MVLHTTLWSKRKDILNQNLNWQKASYSSTARARYEVYIARLFQENDRIITAPHSDLWNGSCHVVNDDNDDDNNADNNDDNNDDDDNNDNNNYNYH